MVNLKNMIEKLFYRKLDGEPSSEVDNLETYLSGYLLKDGFSFVPEDNRAEYHLKEGIVIRIAVLGNFGLVVVESEKNCKGLLEHLKQLYTPVRRPKPLK